MDGGDPIETRSACLATPLCPAQVRNGSRLLHSVTCYEDRCTGMAEWVEPAADGRTSERVRRAVDTIAVGMTRSGADGPVDGGP